MAVPILGLGVFSRKNRARFSAVALTAFVLIAAGCTEKLVAPPPPPPGPLAVPDSIQEVFTQQCGFDGCHGGSTPQRGLQLGVDAQTSYENIVGVAAVNDGAFQRIEAGDSTDSYIVMKLRDDPRIVGNPMPLGGYPMDPALTLRIAAWAAAGAPGVPVATAAMPAEGP